MSNFWKPYAALLLLLPILGCTAKEEKPIAKKDPVYTLAGGCYAVGLEKGAYLRAETGKYAFSAARADEAEPFRFRASDLGHYLLYDTERHFLVGLAPKHASGWAVRRTDQKSLLRIDYHKQYSDAEWAVETPAGQSQPFLLRHLNSGLYLGDGRLVQEENAVSLRFEEAGGCSEFPELPLDAKGKGRSEPWADGQVFGYADAHSHLMTNYGFGGGGIFHGAPFHRLGVEHALEDCDAVHGSHGMRDIVGYFLGGDGDLDPSMLFDVLVHGAVSGFNHSTKGYPKFEDWPDARNSYTHQVQYYRWLERAYLSGLRLMFQHATGNSGLCEFLVGLGAQEAPYGCNDMVSVDLQLEQTRALERYIDAQAGGPGRGWFRIVTSPEEARAEINKGNLAVVLGIEISNLFDCFLNPPPGMPACTPEFVKEQVRRYHEKGVRIVFPVHKYDNGFSAGDGSRGVIEIGNLMNSGHFSNFTLDCPDTTEVHTFDKGNVVFGGLNQPRQNYFSAPPLDVSKLEEKPVATLLPIAPALAGGELEGPYCQAAGLTDLGELLIRELISYGMLIDIAHLPQWSTVRALEILDEHQYPAISTHGNKYEGKIYRHGGTGDANLGTCGDPAVPGQMGASFLAHAKEVRDANGLPAQPLAFDYNGFAGSQGPRFGPNSVCGTPQANPVTYPFKSYDGQVTFEQPTLGERIVDFNEEGMLHVGLLPEHIEIVRLDGTSDEELEPLFRTAETLLRVWETAEKAAR